MADYEHSDLDSLVNDSNFSSGESISHNYRDYTPEFTTDQIFESRDDMLEWARRVGRDNGIVVVIKNSASLKGNKLPKCILGCERGGTYKPPHYLDEGETRQRNTRTKKCSCPFELRGIPIPPNGVMWGLRVSSGFHNHEAAKYLDGHEYPSRLKQAEKKFVIDMGNSTAPREILSVLKERDSLNTTGIKSIYNAILINKEAKRGGLNPIQYVLSQLIKKAYLHDFRTDSTTNEITDILWVHPKSLELYVNFPTVLIIDATYKTNEYRIPLLEVVGITSTMRTYSLMFAYLSNEKEERLTWALCTLKNWMIAKGALTPSVFVSDRDLALINAIEACFPMARHILCIWHINQNVVKNCSPVLGLLSKRFLVLWYSLIMSSTPSSYQQKWQALCVEFRSYPRVLDYLRETWLRPYKERFVKAWIDTCMHLGSNSSQRAESAHARLKKYLGDTMSSLETSFVKIDKMLRNQLGDIKKSFEKSINIPRHKQVNDNIYDELRCCISLEAMELIDAQLQSATNASPHLVGYCDCTIKITCGIPCEHDLAFYRSLSIPIPLAEIRVHWTRLSMDAYQPNDGGHPLDRTSHIIDSLEGMDPDMREHMINKIVDMTDPSCSTVQAPAYNTVHRGRPAGRDEQNRRRIISSVEASGSGSRGASNSTQGVPITPPTPTSRGRRGRGAGVHKIEPTYAQYPVSPVFDPYIQQLPEALRGYITHTVDVQPDGHCGFRAIAALVGYSEDDWRQVRMDLIEEIQQNMDLYSVLYPLAGLANNLLHSLAWFAPTAPTQHWMDSMTLGCVIASRYNLVLHTFEINASGCFTHLPLRSPPVAVRARREIAIARIGQHFVQVFLRPHYPVPPIPLWWWQNTSDEAKGWATRYTVRLNLWSEVMGGGNID